MRTVGEKLVSALVAVGVFGCTSISVPPTARTESPSQSRAAAPQVQKHSPRQWNENQLRQLRSFALQESPKLWHTVQALRAERETRTAALAKLRAELVDFGRNPEADVDYNALKAANDGLRNSLDVILEKIEGAYIAYKKFQATPGNKEYSDMMRRVLNDGLNEASAAESRYLQMSREK